MSSFSPARLHKSHRVLRFKTPSGSSLRGVRASSSSSHNVHYLELHSQEDHAGSHKADQTLDELSEDTHAGGVRRPPPHQRVLLRICAAVALSQIVLLGSWTFGPADALGVSISGRQDSDTLENVPGELTRGECQSIDD